MTETGGCDKNLPSAFIAVLAAVFAFVAGPGNTRSELVVTVDDGSSVELARFGSGTQ